MVIIHREGRIEFGLAPRFPSPDKGKLVSNKSLREELQMPRHYYTLPEASAHLRISYSKLRMMKRRGELPQPVQLGAKKFYTKEQLEGIRQNLMIQAGFTNF